MSSSSSNFNENEHKRKRLTQACELCRRKKIKCDGGKPTCGNCLRLNNTCTYSTSSKKRGPRQGYIEMLEQRLAKMEQILLSEKIEEEQTINAIEENIEHKLGQAKNDKENTDAGQPSVTPTLASLSNSNDSTNVLKNRHLSISTKRSTDDVHDTASTASFSSISSNFPSPPTHLINNQHSIHSFEKNSDLLPLMQLIEHSVDLYFKYLFIAYPIFDEATLRNDIKEKRCPDFLILSLMAACARFSDHPDIKQNPAWHAGETYAEKARQMVMKVVDEPNIPNLQGLVLLTVHEYGCGRGPRTWMYTGIVIRMAMELGLHEEAEENASFKQSHSFEKLSHLEVRRRLFWTIFSMDKFASAAAGRPSSLPSQFCTTFLPTRIDEHTDDQYYTEDLESTQFLMINPNELKNSQLLGTSGSNIGSLSSNSTLESRPYLNIYAYIIRTINLLSKVTAYVNLKGKEKQAELLPCHPDSEFYKLDQEIDSLYDQIPPHLKNTASNLETIKNCKNKEKLALFILLHVLHNTVIVLLHRPSLVIAESLDSEIVQLDLKNFVFRSVKKCMDAVDNVTILLKEVGTCMELITPFMIYLTYTVATVVVNTSFSTKPEEAQKAKKSLGIYFQLLVNARGTWAIADRLYFMVRDLYAIHSNVFKKQNVPKSLDSSGLYQDLQLQNQQQSAQLLQPQQIQQQNNNSFAFNFMQYPQYQQYQQPFNPLQQFQLQYVNNPDSLINNSLVDWTISYHNAAMFYENQMSSTGSVNDIGFFSNSNFQVPGNNDQSNRMYSNMNNQNNRM